MDDSRLEGFIEAVSLDVHAVFGDGFLFLSYLKNMGLTDILREVFRQNRISNGASPICTMQS